MLSTFGGHSSSTQNALLLPSLMTSGVHQVLRHLRHRHRQGAAIAAATARPKKEPPLCEVSLDEVVKGLERSGHLASLVSACRKDLEAQASRLRWSKPPSYVSADTFSETLLRQSVMTPLMATPTLFSRTYERVQKQMVRGFKSKRVTPDGGVPFRKRNGEGVATVEQPRPFFQGLVSGSKPVVNQEVLQVSELTKDDKTKISAALLGFTEGYKVSTLGPPDNKSGGSESTGETKKRRRLLRFSEMFFTSLAASIMAVYIFIAFAQNLGGSLRLNKIGNEIFPEEIDVTFDDVRGCDEAKQELQEIVDFLKNPNKFSALGGKLPKGCLLVGPPGTGKTLLARAVAGQAGVPFFHASGSEFDEVLVGQGARRVRDLFSEAKKKAPCVIFIDEIDTVGSKRTSSVLHPYANQTINQLLAEMDGFVSNEGVIVLGATNRAEELDKALLRPGRFDTRVTVTKPDIKGRREILELYLSKIKHDSSVNVDKLAKMTVGFSGADLENVVNMAAIRAAVDNKDFVTMSEFEYSHDKHVLGTDWKSRVRDKEDLQITAYHEAGHTLVAYFTENAQPLHKVTIVARGASGGHTAFLPEKDSYHETRAQFLASMDVAMGGRAAEELIFGKEKITGGASSDLYAATSTAELMVRKLGMSEKIGLRVFPDPPEGLMPKSPDLGPSTTELIDAEVNVILQDSYKRAVAILKSHRNELDLLANALLNYETLDVDDVKGIIDSKSLQKKSNNQVRSRGNLQIDQDPKKTVPNGSEVFVQ